MSRRIYQPELATKLAERGNISKRKSESFVRAFFDTIATGLSQDKLVKVKGFGTFKVVSVSPRESVNVNTGERITLEGHDKISFTPDPVLKELANKPFAQFQTMTLTDDVTEEELMKVAKRVEEELAQLDALMPNKDCPPAEEDRQETDIQNQTQPEGREDETVTEIESVPPATKDTSDEKPETVQKGESQETALTEADVPTTKPLAATSKTEGEELPMEKPEVTSEDEAIPETGLQHEASTTIESETEDITYDDMPKKANPWKIAALILGAIALFLLGYEAGRRHIFEPTEQTAGLNDTAVATANDTTTKDTLRADTLQVQSKVLPEEPATEAGTTTPPAAQTSQATALPTPQEKIPAAVLPAHPKGNIDVKGLMGTHTLTKGESVASIARKYYGSTEYAPYIIRYNELKNPNVVHVGTKLKLPKLAVRN